MGGISNEQPSMHAPGVPNDVDPATISQPQIDGSVAAQELDGQEIPSNNVSQPEIAPAAPDGEPAADAVPEVAAPAQPVAES